MSKCDICKSNINEGLLGKIKGVHYWSGKKLQSKCSKCQKSEKDNKKVK